MGQSERNDVGAGFACESLGLWEVEGKGGVLSCESLCVSLILRLRKKRDSIYRTTAPPRHILCVLPTST